MQNICRILLVALLVWMPISIARGQDTADTSAKDKLIVETILRMESFDYQKASPKVTAAVGRYLSTQGASDQYFALVDRFLVTDQSATLLAIALADANGKGARAVQSLLLLKAEEAIFSAITDQDSADDSRERLMRSLALTEQPAALAILHDVVVGDEPLSVRTAATKALGASRAGELALLAIVVDEKLPEDLSATAAATLGLSANEAIRTEASRHLTLSGSGAADAPPLPPVADLIARTGDAAKGKEIYARVCFICHQIGSEGIAFGPALTEIGDKLPKDALYSAILEPSAAISFGFEGYQFTLKDGSLRIGIIASETDSEVVIRVPGGVTNSVEKSQLAEREKLKESLMPANLHQAMSENELVDLIAFLSTLRK
ncbi:MAG: c-type cytochrome [Verrucomicrobiales bacterium]